MTFMVRVLLPPVLFVSSVNVATSQSELTFNVVSVKEDRGETSSPFFTVRGTTTRGYAGA